MASPKAIEEHVLFRIYSRRGLKFQRFLLVKWHHRGLNKNTQNRTMKMSTAKSSSAHKGFRSNGLAKNSQGRPVRKTLLQTLVRRI